MKTPHRLYKIILCCALLIAALPAQAELDKSAPSAAVMAADAFIARPMYFLASQVGALVYVTTLPFSLMGKNANQAAETLVVSPLQSTFIRCLGCKQPSHEVLKTETGTRKKISHFVNLKVGQSQVDLSGKEEAINYGLYFGSNFKLGNFSHYDVMLGYHALGEFKNAGNKTNLQLIEMNSRFGRELFARVSIIGKLGINYWNNNRFFEADKSQVREGFGYLYGIGLDVRITDNIRTALEYGQYHLSKSKGQENIKLKSTELNVMVHF